MSGESQQEVYLGGAGANASALPSTLLEDAQLTMPSDLQRLQEYEKKINEIVNISSINGPLYMQDFLKGKELASRMYAEASYRYEKAVDAARKERAIAYLERSHEHFTKTGRKATDEACKMFAETDPGYRKARELEAYYLALGEYLKHKVYMFQSAHDDAKKIYDQMGEAFGSSTAVPSGRNGQ